jgi:methionyl-tRNA synthetase
MPFENDSVFTFDDFDKRYNSDLANDIGNALNRAVAMTHKFAGGKIPDAPIDERATAAVKAAKTAYEGAMHNYRLDEAARAAIDLVRSLNKQIDTWAPWALAKANDASLASVLRSMLFWIRSAEGLLRPIAPAAADAIARQLNLVALSEWGMIGSEDSLPVDVELGEAQPIFPRLDLKTAKKMEQATDQNPIENTKKDATKPDPVVEQISIEDFMKVQLKVGRILEAEPLEGSDKLLKLQVVIGAERRQVVAGIRSKYAPEDIVGMQVVVVTNLKPAKLRGTESQGMLLAAVDSDGGAILLTPEREAPEGSTVR